jgi:hypothetical protein
MVLELHRNSPLWSSFTLPRRKWRSEKGAPPEFLIEPRWSHLLRGKSFSSEKSKAEVHSDGQNFLFNVKMNFKLKINVIRNYIELQIYPTKPSF